MTEQRFYAFHSKTALERHGGLFEWLTSDGKPVECTVVVADEPDGEFYQWPDKVFMGEVVECSRIIIPNKMELFQ